MIKFNVGVCREDRRQGPRNNNTNLQPNQQPSLAEIDGEIGQEGLGLECVEDRLQANAQAGGRQW